MINITAKENCCGCWSCYNVCPVNCISMDMDEEGFIYPQVNKNKCTNCNLCEKVCPMINISTYDIRPEVYACKNKDDNIRFKSSSGGVFSILSDYVLENNGIVYGAGFNDKFEVVHMAVENKEELYKLRGSKYVQGSIYYAFRQIKEYLQNDRLVLFSGTPCQIAGLNSYLGKKYENLLLIDIVCHGVPSPGVFEKYLDYMEKLFNSNIRSVNFRAKELSIQAIKICFDNNKIYLKNPSEDMYYIAFLDDLILRPSCYACKHNNFRSGSDITLADYWGASTRFHNFNEREGVSLVITKTEKGKWLFDLLSDKLELVRSDLEHAVKYNPNIIESRLMNPKRFKFFTEYAKGKIPINKLLIKYTNRSLIKRGLRKIKRTAIKVYSAFK